MKALLLFTARGERVLVEGGESGCCDTEEVAQVEVDVPAGTECDVCGEPMFEESRS